jgi:hypothetical protein
MDIVIQVCHNMSMTGEILPVAGLAHLNKHKKKVTKYNHFHMLTNKINGFIELTNSSFGPP